MKSPHLSRSCRRKTVAAFRSCRRKTVAQSPLIRALASAPTFHALASAATLLLAFATSTLRAQTTNEPPPFLRAGPSLTQAPEGATPFVKNRWIDRNGDGWDDIWCLISAMPAPNDKTKDTDGDGVSDYDEMLHWRDPRVKGPPLGWPHYTVEELLQAQIANEAMRRTNEAAMARRREVLRGFAALPVGHDEQGRALTLREVRARHFARVRERVAREAPLHAARMAKAKAELRRKGRPEVVELSGGGVHALGWADRAGNPIFYALDNAMAAKTISADKVWADFQTSGTTPQAISGATVAVGHWDGADALLSHADLGPQNVRSYDRDGDSPANFSLAGRAHATHTAGTIIGLGGNAAAKGMAPGAVLNTWDLFGDLGEFPDLYTTALSAERIQVTNHSYGVPWGWTNPVGAIPWWGPETTALPIISTTDPNMSVYNEVSRQWDQKVCDGLGILPVFSAGNNHNEGPGPASFTAFFASKNKILVTYQEDPSLPGSGLFGWFDGAGTGYLLPPNDGYAPGQNGYATLNMQACAKNVLTVGSVEDLPGGYASPQAVALAPYSSRGPVRMEFGAADFDRVKPDLVANGQDLFSTSLTAGGGGAYAVLHGTSMAAPSVTGALALLLEVYRDRYGAAAQPWASTLKCLAIHTADEVDSDGESDSDGDGSTATDYDGPDYSHGWGLMNARSAAQLIADDALPLGAAGARHPFIKEVLLSGEMEIPLVATGAGALRITICWSDPPAEAPIVLWEDVDITLTGPGGAVTYPWKLSALTPSAPATRGDNDADVVRQVVIPAPVPGATYLLRLARHGPVLEAGAAMPQPAPQPEAGMFDPLLPVSACLSGAERGTPPEFKIDAIERTDVERYTLQWQSVPGEVYRVESSTDLVSWARGKDLNGQERADVIPQGVLSTLEVPAEVSGETRRFWRLRLLQPWED